MEFIFNGQIIDENSLNSVISKFYQEIYDDYEDMYHGLEVNIAIASAITGPARMLMSSVKNRADFKLYFSDTDSIVIDSKLPPSAKHSLQRRLG